MCDSMFVKYLYTSGTLAEALSINIFAVLIELKLLVKCILYEAYK